MISWELYVVSASLIAIAVQLSLCFSVKKLAFRLMPCGLLFGSAAILVLAGLIVRDTFIVCVAYAFYLSVPLLACFAGWAVWWIIATLTDFVRRSTKKQIVTLFSVIAAAVLVIVAVPIIFKQIYPTHYPYKDSEIIGSTPEEITDIYGEFAKFYRYEESNSAYAAYLIRDNTPEWIMSYDNSLWYEIRFEDGVAVRVNLQEGRGGG